MTLSSRPIRFGVAVLVLAATAITALLFRAGGGSPSGTPLLTEVRLAGQPVPVLVVPQRPGWNLVQIGLRHASAGLDRERLAPTEQRPGAGHSWVKVHLPEGRSELWVSAGGVDAAVALDAGSTPSTLDMDGPDAPECANAAIGTLVAGATERLDSCPADRLDTREAAALASTVGFIAARGIRTVALVGDSSPRGQAAEREVRTAAARHGLTVTAAGRQRVPVMVLSGWTAADAALRDIAAGKVAAEGAYLAPWLLSGPLLAHPAGTLIPLWFTPRDAAAHRYVEALDGRFPGQPATAGGYAAWLRARGETADQRSRLFAASTIQLPGLPVGHHAAAASWLPGGTIVAISGPLDQA